MFSLLSQLPRGPAQKDGTFSQSTHTALKKEFRSSAARLVQWSAHPALKEATSQLQHVVPSGALFGIADGDAR